jgi:ribonuclease T2
MKRPSSVVVAIAALIVALAAWLGIDLEALTGRDNASPAQPPISAPDRQETAEAQSPVPPPGTAAPPAVPPGAFDYYVLALSWSPSYCEAEASERDRLQCGGRPFHFIVHGLWPQNDRGYPEDCLTDQPRVSDALVDEMLDIMPSRGLIGHQWRKHGACTGLSQEDYFAAVRSAFERVDIPDRFEVLDRPLSVKPQDIATAFLDANRGTLTTDAVVVTCGGGTRLDEVRLCMGKDLRFRACGQQTKRSSCRRPEVRMPPVRG